MNENLIFVYNSFSHMTMIFIYIIYNKNINNLILTKKYLKNLPNIIYILGHLFITFTMMYRIPIEFRGNMAVTILGSTGHSLLICYMLLSIYIYKQQVLNKYTIIFLVGQLGMVYVYWTEHFKKQLSSLDKLHLIFFLSPLILLFIFYLNYFLTHKGIIKFPNLLISIVYLLLFILSIYQYKNNKYISIF